MLLATWIGYLGARAGPGAGYFGAWWWLFGLATGVPVRGLVLATWVGYLGARAGPGDAGLATWVGYLGCRCGAWWCLCGAWCWLLGLARVPVRGLVMLVLATWVGYLGARAGPGAAGLVLRARAGPGAGWVLGSWVRVCCWLLGLPARGLVLLELATWVPARGLVWLLGCPCGAVQGPVVGELDWLLASDAAGWLERGLVLLAIWMPARLALLLATCCAGP